MGVAAEPTRDAWRIGAPFFFLPNMNSIANFGLAFFTVNGYANRSIVERPGGGLGAGGKKEVAEKRRSFSLGTHMHAVSFDPTARPSCATIEIRTCVSSVGNENECSNRTPT